MLVMEEFLHNSCHLMIVVSDIYNIMVICIMYTMILRKLTSCMYYKNWILLTLFKHTMWLDVHVYSKGWRAQWLAIHITKVWAHTYTVNGQVCLYNINSWLQALSSAIEAYTNAMGLPGAFATVLRLYVWNCS